MSKKIMMIMLVVLVLVTGVVFAYEVPNNINPASVMVSASQVSTAVSDVLSLAQWIGFIVGIAMIVWVGVKYLTAGAGTKADVKSTMVPILVGAFLVALAPTIAKWLFETFNNE